MDIASELIRAGQESARLLRDRVTEVAYGPGNGIRFKLDGIPYTGEMKGRNADLLLGFGEIQDKAVAIRVLIDKHARPV